MRSEYLGYRRATTVSLLGLGLQLGLAALLFVYAYLSRDHAAMSAFLYVAIGALVWLTLVVVYDQHRREQIEAFEAEAFAASDAAASSVFDEGASELRVAARRLAMMHKILVPLMSLLVGGLLLGVGLWRFAGGQARVSPDDFSVSQDRFFVLFVSIAVGAFGFIFARFISGMAQQKVWSMLSAGASFAVGASIFGLLIAVGHFVDIAGPDTMLRYLQVIIPAIMVGLGGEVVLHFVLDIYRPRKAGELARPAMDSRVLGLIAAPDKIAESISEAINYQLGFDVTGSWFYRLLSRSLALLVVMGALIGWAMTSVTVIRADQRGMLLRFGRIVNADLGPGAHLKMPWPIDRVVIPEIIERDEGGKVVRRVASTSGVREIQLGTNPPDAGTGPILWTMQHSLEERFTIVQTGRDNADSQEKDFALVALEVPVQFVIEDVRLFEELGPPEMREKMLKAVGERAVQRFVSALTIDDVLGGPDRDTAQGPADLAVELRREVEEAFAQMNPGSDGVPRGAGIRVLFVGAQGAHPPKDVAPQFEQVVQAEQRTAARLEAAHTYEIGALTEVVGSVEKAREIIDELNELERLRQASSSNEARVLQNAKIEEIVAGSGGEAAKIMANARAVRWERHMSDRSRAMRYAGRLAAYEASEPIYKAILYFDALKSAMSGARVYIVDERVPLHLRLELQDISTRGDAFKGAADDSQ